MLTIIYYVDGAGIADVPSGRSFFGFMNDVIAGLRRNGKERTSETYTSALNSFRRFMEGRDITADAINSGLIVDYQRCRIAIVLKKFVLGRFLLGKFGCVKYCL